MGLPYPASAFWRLPAQRRCRSLPDRKKQRARPTQHSRGARICAEAANGKIRFGYHRFRGWLGSSRQRPFRRGHRPPHAGAGRHLRGIRFFGTPAWPSRRDGPMIRKPAGSSLTTRSWQDCAWTRSVPTSVPSKPHRTDRGGDGTLSGRQGSLDHHTGVSHRIAEVLIAEIGADMTDFQTQPARLVEPESARAPTSPPDTTKRQ